MNVEMTESVISMFQAREKIKQLEESINESQAVEKQLLDLSQWMTEVNKEIQNRLDADVLAGDVPEESEVSLCYEVKYFNQSNYFIALPG